MVALAPIKAYLERLGRKWTKRDLELLCQRNFTLEFCISSKEIWKISFRKIAI